MTKRRMRYNIIVVKYNEDNMKKYFKFIVAALVILIFIGTFVFLYVKSMPQEVVYEELTPQKMDINRTTILTGKIESRNEVNCFGNGEIYLWNPTNQSLTQKYPSLF